METFCYALSKRGGGLANMGFVADGDFLYKFEVSSPEWVESIEIIYEKKLMLAAWQYEADLWIIIPGSPPKDEPMAKQIVLSQIFVNIEPLALIRTAPMLYTENFFFRMKDTRITYSDIIFLNKFSIVFLTFFSVSIKHIGNDVWQKFKREILLWLS